MPLVSPPAAPPTCGLSTLDGGMLAQKILCCKMLWDMGCPHRIRLGPCIATREAAWKALSRLSSALRSILALFFARSLSIASGGPNSALTAAASLMRLRCRSLNGVIRTSHADGWRSLSVASACLACLTKLLRVNSGGRW